MLALIFLAENVKAFEFDNIKQYTPLTETIEIRNSFLGIDWLSMDRVATLKLLSPKHNVIWGTGYQRVAEIEIENAQDYDLALRSMDFYKVYFGLQKINNPPQFSYKVKTTKTVTEDLIGCANTLQKAGEICKYEVIGKREVVVDDWVDLDTSKPLPAGHYIIGIYYSDVKVGETIEWIPTFFGLRLTEWGDFTGATKIEYMDSVAGDTYYLATTTRNSAQTFTVGSTTAGTWTLVGFSMELLQSSAPGTMTFSLYATNSSGAPTGSPLVQNTTVNGNSIPVGTYGWFNISMPAYDLSNGVKYAMVIERTSAGEIRWNTKGSTNPYTYGQFFDNTAGWSIPGADIDQRFQVYATTTTAPYNITTTLNTPANLINFSTTSITFNATTNAVGTVNLSNATLYVWNSSALAVQDTTTLTGNVSVSNVWTKTLYDENFTWNVRSCGFNLSMTTICNWGTNRTFKIDTLSPTLTFNAPTTNFTTLTLPINVTLNFTAQDLHLSSCWFNSTYNATRTMFTCNSAPIVTNISRGYNTIYYGANDTFGNTATGQKTFYVYYIQTTSTATNPITEGGLSSHSLTLDMTNITQWNVVAWLVWNNTNKGYGAQTNLSSNSMRFDISFIVPPMNSTNQTTWTWYYNITDNPNVTAWNISGNQSIVPLSISECGAGMQKILNYTIYDEKTKVVSDGTNATIEVDLTLTSSVNSSLTYDFYGKKTGSPTYLICLPNGALNNSNFYLDSVAKYDYGSPSSTHVVEYHYIENFNLSYSTAPQVVRLYDLLATESTSFLITYQDENYLYVQDAIVDIWRYYVGDGAFLSVEHGKTDAGGQTRAHLTTEDIIYKALVWKDGQLLYSSPEFLALCQATPCQINLRQSQSTNDSYSDYENIIYSYSENRTLRAVTLAFATKDGTSTTMNLSIIRANQYENETVNQSSLTTSGGQITLTVPTTFGNDTYRVLVYKDGSYFGSTTLNLKTSAKDIFGNTGIILSAFSFLMLALMGITSGIAVIVLGLIGLALMGMVQVFESGSVFGIGSAIVWLFVAGAIIIYKIVNRRVS